MSRVGGRRTGRDAGGCCRGGGIATRPASSDWPSTTPPPAIRAYRSDALERMEFESVTADGYGFQVEMTYRLVRIGGKVVEFPITFRDRTAGISKMSGGIVREALVIVIKLWVDDFGGRRRRRRQGG